MNRRSLLRFALAGLTAPLLGLGRVSAVLATSKADISAMQNRWRELFPKGETVVSPSPTLDTPLREWKKALPKLPYEVLFEEDTERPFTSPLNNEKRAGVFVCRACDLPLFSSEMKYDSGTGWPSFFTAIPDHLATKSDFKLIWPRTEYHCVKCGGHQGHIFDDGPAPTGQRWCNNGAALRFISAQDA